MALPIDLEPFPLPPEIHPDPLPIVDSDEEPRHRVQASNLQVIQISDSSSWSEIESKMHEQLESIEQLKIVQINNDSSEPDLQDDDSPSGSYSEPRLETQTMSEDQFEIIQDTSSSSNSRR